MKDLRGAYDFETEVKPILRAAQQNNIDDFVLLCVLAFTGRRLCEIIGKKAKPNDKYPPIKGLCPEDIAFKRGYITWTIEKQFNSDGSRVRRTIPVKPWLLELLRNYVLGRRLEKSKCIFNTSMRRVNYMVHRYLKQLGIQNKKRVVHAFRHSFALHLAKNAKNPMAIKQIQELLAHSSPEITMEYFKYTDTKARELLDTL